ncbi:hypothetical protein M422DRAFT_261275 [Sphaerobolus stellatus SS14]|uniref:Uncharacterized protein n=1 Tax=Sphaerobolus stellatus (strain SS14) TaxID=990650 RepID=A0A0C9VFE1_SPHS4|nr:hypothetical protein M422DRAFT_261275 [Sphaerobolus stellatus SS14]
MAATTVDECGLGKNTPSSGYRQCLNSTCLNYGTNLKIFVLIFVAPQSREYQKAIWPSNASKLCLQIIVERTSSPLPPTSFCMLEMEVYTVTDCLEMLRNETSEQAVSFSKGLEKAQEVVTRFQKKSAMTNIIIQAGPVATELFWFMLHLPNRFQGCL